MITMSAITQTVSGEVVNKDDFTDEMRRRAIKHTVYRTQ